MTDFKTHLNALLESFGLDTKNAQTISILHSSSGEQNTEFTPPCDGFLVCYTNESATAITLRKLSSSEIIFSIKSLGTPTWLADNALVSKGFTYQLTVNWRDSGSASTNSKMVFYPFSYSRQKS